MHWVIPTVGSAGDVLPLIALGTCLRDRGHCVTVIANAGFRETCLRAGLAFIPLSTDEKYERVLKDKWILATRYSALFWQRHAVGWNAAIYRFLRESSGADLAVVSADRPNLWADLLAFRELRAPVIRVRIDLPPVPPRQPVEEECSGVQRMLEERWQGAWQDRAASFGLSSGAADIGRLMRDIRPRIPTVALWPELLAAEEARIRGYLTYGFVLPPDGGEAEGAIGEHLVFFLGTEGTTGNWVRTFIEVSGGICEALQCRGIVLGGKGAGARSVPLPDRLDWREFVPISDVLRGARAVVHHGGIGTAAAAMALGIPQLALPRVFMQPANAEWLRRAGICRTLDPRDYTVSNGVREIETLTADGGYRARALALAAQPGFRADPNRVCTFLEAAAIY